MQTKEELGESENQKLFLEEHFVSELPVPRIITFGVGENNKISRPNEISAARFF